MCSMLIPKKASTECPPIQLSQRQNYPGTSSSFPVLRIFFSVFPRKYNFQIDIASEQHKLSKMVCQLHISYGGSGRVG